MDIDIGIADDFAVDVVVPSGVDIDFDREFGIDCDMLTPPGHPGHPTEKMPQVSKQEQRFPGTTQSVTRCREASSA
eukprot:5918600-Lingulodinium_polyedra.AAC.1